MPTAGIRAGTTSQFSFVIKPITRSDVPTMKKGVVKTHHLKNDHRWSSDLSSFSTAIAIESILTPQRVRRGCVKVADWSSPLRHHSGRSGP